MTLARFDLSLTLLSPFVTGGDANPTFGVDGQLPRALGSRRVPIIPGALVRGVLRDALTSLCGRGGGHVPGDRGITVEIATDLFGRASGAKGLQDSEDDEGAGGAPQRGLLAFGDLLAATPEPEKSDTLTRIEIEPELGAAREGQLQVIELPWPIGAQVEFKGEIVARDGVQPAVIERSLKAALAVVPALGAAKSAGFGALAGFSVKLRPAPARAPATVRPSASNLYRATLVFDGPFLVAADRPAPNVFAGSAFVPGGAIKGAVADAWGVKDDVSAEGKFLARTTFREAWPDLAEGKRPVVPPFSLAVYGGGSAGELRETLLDAAPAPRTVGRAANLPAAFDIDWKETDMEAICEAFERLSGQPSADAFARKLDHQVRTRNAINYQTGAADQRKGEGGALFVYDLVAPSMQGTTREWRFDILLDGPDDRSMLERLANTEFLIGKAPTVARITKLDAPNGKVTQRAPAGDPRLQGAYALHLLTPALLTPLARLRHHEGDVAATYLESFQAIFGCNVAMPRFFARQKLIGGWQAMRYPPRPGGGYEPWVLTEAGSVFALHPPRAEEERFKSALKRILAEGLPEQGSPLGKAWRVCPFPRTNGYGEIRLWSPNVVGCTFS